MEPNYRSPVITAAMRKNIEVEIADRRLVLAGEFASEIAHMEALRATTDEKLGMVKTVDEAATVLAAAHSEAAKRIAASEQALEDAKRDAADLHTAASGAVEIARARANDVIAQEAALAAKEAALAAKEAAHASAVQSAAGRLHQIDVATAHLADRESRLLAAETEHAACIAALAAREQRFNAKLDALKIA